MFNPALMQQMMQLKSMNEGGALVPMPEVGSGNPVPMPEVPGGNPVPMPTVGPNKGGSDFGSKDMMQMMLLQQLFAGMNRGDGGTGDTIRNSLGSALPLIMMAYKDWKGKHDTKKAENMEMVDNPPDGVEPRQEPQEYSTGNKIVNGLAGSGLMGMAGQGFMNGFNQRPGDNQTGDFGGGGLMQKLMSLGSMGGKGGGLFS